MTKVKDFIKNIYLKIEDFFVEAIAIFLTGIPIKKTLIEPFENEYVLSQISILFLGILIPIYSEAISFLPSLIAYTLVNMIFEFPKIKKCYKETQADILMYLEFKNITLGDILDNQYMGKSLSNVIDHLSMHFILSTVGYIFIFIKTFQFAYSLNKNIWFLCILTDIFFKSYSYVINFFITYKVGYIKLVSKTPEEINNIKEFLN